MLESAHARAHLRKRVVYSGENTRATVLRLAARLLLERPAFFKSTVDLAIESAFREAPSTS